MKSEEKRRIINLEDDKIKRDNFIEEIHRMIHEFERVIQKEEGDGQGISGQSDWGLD